METPFLDQLIEEHQNHIEIVEAVSYAGVTETRKQLAELEAIKAIIITHSHKKLKDKKVKDIVNLAKSELADENKMKVMKIKTDTDKRYIKILNKIVDLQNL